MPFTVPEFPLSCNVYDFFTNVIPAPRLIGVECNLAIGKRVQSVGAGRGSLGGCIGLPPTLLCPGGTDIRDNATSLHGPDVVEVPAGSQRWYLVDDVEPLGLGFDNWHVAAALIKMSTNIDGTFSAMVWPTPDPFVMANFP